MTVDRRALAAGLAMLLLVAACGGSATSTPSNGPGASDPGIATPEPADTTEPAATDGGSIGGPGTAADLEALLPDEVNGVQLEKSSFDGSTFPGGIPIGEGDDEFIQFLQDNGKSLDDLRVAIAAPVGSEGGGTFIMAIQVKGLPADKVKDFALAGSEDLAPATVGGKQVYGSGMAGFGAWVYPKDDVVYYVLVMGGEDLAEGIFQQLP
jgi:hypothetical protein